MIGFLRTSPIAILMGVLSGLFASILGPLMADEVKDAYNARNPPWIGVEASIISRDKESIQVTLYGTRVRTSEDPGLYAGGCRFLRSGAHALSLGDGWDARIRRLDNEETGRTRPAGPQHIGTFDIRPILNARLVEVRVEFMCWGRPFTQVLARLPLEGTGGVPSPVRRPDIHLPVVPLT